MKNIITIIAICFMAFNANAQKVTKKILEGKWMLIHATLDGSQFDIKNSTVKLTPEYLAGYKNKTPEQANAMAIKQMNREMAGNYFTFSKETVEFKFLADTIDTESYELSETDGKYYITTPSDKYIVRIVGKMLHLEVPAEGQELKLILERQ